MEGFAISTVMSESSVNSKFQKGETMFDYQTINKFCSVCRALRGCVPQCPLRVFLRSIILSKEKQMGIKEAAKLSFRRKPNVERD